MIDVTKTNTYNRREGWTGTASLHEVGLMDLKWFTTSTPYIIIIYNIIHSCETLIVTAILMKRLYRDSET